MKIEVLPPEVNESKVGFSVVDGKIRFGLMAVKNVGEGPAQAIENERENGEFSSLADFVSRIPTKALNRRTLESLIHAGACDSLEKSRAQMSASVEAMLEYGHKVAEKHNLLVTGGSDCHDTEKRPLGVDGVNAEEWEAFVAEFNKLPH